LVAEQLNDQARLASGRLEDPRAMLQRMNALLSMVVGAFLVQNETARWRWGGHASPFAPGRCAYWSVGWSVEEPFLGQARR
jgi:hypothetical protein